MIGDDALAATCIADEAGNQQFEGKCAVGVVIKNRMTLKYQSDGTVEGTVLHPMAFSGFWCDFVDGRYTRVCHSSDDAQERAQQKYEAYSNQAIWADCQRAWRDAQAYLMSAPLSFIPGPQFLKLRPTTVLYLNPSVVSPLPAWATSDKLDATIFAHSFYRG